MSFPRRFKPVVTDHALVRWLERVHGMDLDKIREQILDHGRDAWVAQGAVKVHVPSLKITLVAIEGRVVTINPKAER